MTVEWNEVTDEELLAELQRRALGSHRASAAETVLRNKIADDKERERTRKRLGL